jgi:hypothetical protein
MNEQLAQEYLTDAAKGFEVYKNLAEKAFAQISDEEFFRALDRESNSIAAIAKHIGGNLRSRWRDFLNSDGEKPDRNRDAEFITESDTRESVMQLWNEGWQILFDTLKSLRAEDLEKTVKIRGEDHTVVKAINRAMLHTASHIGQIVFLAKHFRSETWQTLSIPRSRSQEFNSFVESKTEKQPDYEGNWRDFAQK